MTPSLFEEPPPAQVVLPDLWDFQGESVDRLRDGLRLKQGGQVLSSPTGSGKTVIAQYMIASAALKGSRSLFVVDGLDLMDQTSKRFWEYGIDHGLYGGGERGHRGKQTVIAMAQTLIRMPVKILLGFLKTFDVVFPDECHVIFRKLMDALLIANVPYIGLTATPLTKGLGKVYPGGLVQVTTTNRLTDTGRLAPLIFRPAVEIDMTGAPVQANGEWADETVRERGRPIIGDIVSNWVSETNKFFDGPVPTMVFSADIAHGEDICRGFQQAGYDFRQVTAYTKPEDRKRTMAAFRAGECQGVVSVAALGKGIDIPEVRCLVIARPLRKGFMAFVQMLGRGMRAAPGKTECLVCDNAGNTLGWEDELADFFENGISALDDSRFRKVTRKARPRKEIVCSCGTALLANVRICPTCGKERKRRTEVESVPGRPITIEPVRKGRTWHGTEADLWSACCKHATQFFYRHGDADRAKRQAKATFYELSGNWPPEQFRFTVTDGRVPAVIRRKIDQNYRAYRKKQETAAA